jgi:hypothetical protein
MQFQTIPFRNSSWGSSYGHRQNTTSMPIMYYDIPQYVEHLFHEDHFECSKLCQFPVAFKLIWAESVISQPILREEPGSTMRSLSIPNSCLSKAS